MVLFRKYLGDADNPVHVQCGPMLQMDLTWVLDPQAKLGFWLQADKDLAWIANKYKHKGGGI